MATVERKKPSHRKSVSVGKLGLMRWLDGGGVGPLNTLRTIGVSALRPRSRRVAELDRVHRAARPARGGRASSSGFRRGLSRAPSPEEELAARRHLPEPRRGELFARLPGLRTATGPDGTRLGSELNENGGCPFSQTRERGAHLLLTAWPDCSRVRSGNADVCRRGEGPPWNRGPDRSPRPVSH